MKFLELGVPEKLCVVLEQGGITEPTAVQNGAIPAALSGRDVISSARTGSGKTLAYALPMIARLSQNAGATALILVPTRELGVQVQGVLQPYLRAMQIPAPVLVIGGVSFGAQAGNLRRNPRVVIATPGRLIDHLQNGKLRLDTVRALVLDEADRMLDMGFLPQVKQILKHLSSDRQTMLFTATMPSDLKQAIQTMMRDPLQISVDSPNVANVDIEQTMLEVSQDGKTDALLEAINGQVDNSVIVFARTKRRTDRVAKFLEGYGVRAERIHGDRSQAQRQNAINLFRSGKVKILVATDIAARGLDIPLVELVINFDLPEAKEDYVHRIGRTGRAGAKGVALSFVAPDERGHWADITGAKRPPGTSGRPPRQQQQGRGGRPGGGGGGFQGRGRPQGGGRSFGGSSERREERQHAGQQFNGQQRERSFGGGGPGAGGPPKRPRGSWGNRSTKREPATTTSW